MNADPLRFINQKIYTQADLDRVRQEARLIAFKDAKDALQSPAAGTMASTEFRRGFEKMRQLAVRALDLASVAEQKGEKNEV